jgi:hypothetical protein
MVKDFNDHVSIALSPEFISIVAIATRLKASLLVAGLPIWPCLAHLVDARPRKSVAGMRKSWLFGGQPGFGPSCAFASFFKVGKRPR